MGQNGNIIGPQNVPTHLQASGVWGLRDLYWSSRGNSWPKGTFRTEVGSFQVTNGTGNQDITITTDLTAAVAGSWAIIFWSAGPGSTSGSWSSSVMSSVGFVANGGGTVGQYAAATAIWDGQTTSSAKRRTAAKAYICQVVNNAALQYIEFEMGATPFPSATTMRINKTTNSDQQTPQINYMIISGLTGAKAVSWTVPTTSSTSKSVTGVGFRPDLVMHATAMNVAIPAADTDSYFGFGVMNKHGQQWSNGFASDDGIAGSNSSRFQQTDACLATTAWGESAQIQAHYSSMDTDGFTVFQSNNSGTAQYVISLCLQGVSSKIGAFTTEAGAVPFSQTVNSRQGFMPKAVLFTEIGRGPSGSPATEAYWGLGASDLTNQRRVSLWDADSNNPSDANSVWYNDRSLGRSGGTTDVGSLSAVDTNTFTIDWSVNVGGGGRENLYLLLGASGADTFPTSRLDTATTNAAATAHSNQKKVAVLDSGRMVRVIAETTSNARFEWSDDGQIWTDYGADIAGWENGSLIVAPINGTEYLFVVWKQNGTGGGRTDDSSYVAVGTFASSQTSLSWGGITNGGLIGDSRLDVSDLVVSQNGTGGTLHVFQSYSQTAGGTINNTYHAWWLISSTGALSSVTNVELGTTGGYGVAAHTYPSAAYDPVANRLHVAWSAGAPGSGKGIRYRTGTLSGSTVTWATEVELNNLLYVSNPANEAVVCRWDAGRSVVVVAGFFYEATARWFFGWDSSTFTSFTQRIATSVPYASHDSASYGLGFAVDPLTGDWYYFGSRYLSADYADVRYRRATRSGATLTLGSPVTTDSFIGSGTTHSAYVNAFPIANGIGWIYTAGNNSPYTVKYDRLQLG